MFKKQRILMSEKIGVEKKKKTANNKLIFSIRYLLIKVGHSPSKKNYIFLLTSMKTL